MVITDPPHWIDNFISKGIKYDKIVEMIAELNTPTVAPIAHKTSHEDGGGDEISVAGLSGDLADLQDPKLHKTSHEDGGGDEINGNLDLTGLKLGGAPASYVNDIDIVMAASPTDLQLLTAQAIKEYIDEKTSYGLLQYVRPEAGCVFPESAGATDISIEYPAADNDCFSTHTFIIPRGVPSGKTWYYKFYYISHTSSDSYVLEHSVSVYGVGDVYAGWNIYNAVSLGAVATTVGWERFSKEVSIGAVVNADDTVNIKIKKTSSDTRDLHIAGMVLYWR